MVRIRALVWSNHSSLLSDLQKAEGQSANETWVFSFLVPVHVYRLALWAKFSADCILQIWNIFFFFFSQKKRFDISCILWRQFAWNVKPVSWKIMKTFTKCILLILFFHGDNLPEMSKPVLLGQIRKSISKYLLLFLFFPRKQDLTFHSNCLPWRQFAWNVKTCFLGKIRNYIIGLLHWYWWILSQVGISSFRASVDIPSRDNIHQYQCDNPFII